MFSLEPPAQCCMFSIELPAQCSDVLNCWAAESSWWKDMPKISSSSKVTGCAENSSFSNSDIQTENGRSQCFTPQKCPMKIQCRVHSVYSWTFHWEHVTAITYYAYKFQIFSNIPKYFQLLGCLDLLFELQRTLQGHSSSATASYHQAAKASLSLGVDKPPQ